MRKPSDFHLQIDYYYYYYYSLLRHIRQHTSTQTSIAIYPLSRYFFTINIVDEIVSIAHPYRTQIAVGRLVGMVGLLEPGQVYREQCSDGDNESGQRYILPMTRPMCFGNCGS